VAKSKESDIGEEKEVGREFPVTIQARGDLLGGEGIGSFGVLNGCTHGKGKPDTSIELASIRGWHRKGAQWHGGKGNNSAISGATESI